MTWKRRIGWILLGIAALFFFVLAGGYLYLKSSFFERYALGKIEEKADAATGGKTTIGGMDFSLSKLTATFYDITLKGREGADHPPLLHADKLTVSAKIVSLRHHKVSLRELLIERPLVHIQVGSDGTSNLPTAPPSQGGTHTNVFDLAVGHVKLTNGEVDYKDRKTPLDADLRDLVTDIRFTDISKTYNGSVSYRSGRVSYGNHSPLMHDLISWFSATPDKFNVSSAKLRVGSSDILLQAEVANYSNPIAEANYKIRIHTQDFRELLQGTHPEGDVMVTGNLHYQAIAKRPFLDGLSVDGRVASDTIAASAAGRRADLRRLDGRYSLTKGNLSIRNLSMDYLGGHIEADAQMNHLDATPESKVRASLRNISLRALQALSGSPAPSGAELSGTIGGTADASWTGRMEMLKARADLTVQARAESKANPTATAVPVNGAIHVVYDGRSGTIELHNTALRTPAANLVGQGTISNHSRLQLQLEADDLHLLVAVASSFRTGQTRLPAVSGKATVSAVVQGSVKKPSITAQLNAQNLQVEGSEWTSARMTVNADPAHVSVLNGSLVNTHKGQASFSAEVRLNDWAYRPNDPIQARLDAHQIRITDLMAVARKHYSVSGELTAKLSLNGSEANPAGSGLVEIANANVYGESVDRLVTNVRAGNGSLETTMTATARAGSVNADLTYTPKTKAYKVQINAPGIALQKLRMVKAKNVPVSGTVKAFVNGEGTLDDPQLVATIQLPELQARGQSIYEMQAEARVAQHKLDWNIDSKVSQVSVRGQGQIALSGDYDTEGSIDTDKFPIQALLESFAQNIPAGFQGQTELHATVKGPLKDASKLEAHLSIPTLNASYQSLELGIARPIRADYANSIVTLEPADIEGTGTSIHVEGRVPIKAQATPMLRAQGTVDLRILRMVVPDVSSGGTIALDLHSSGSAVKPGVEGQLQLKNVAMTTPDAPIGIEKLNGTLNVSNDRVELSQVTGQMGGGQVTFGGSITYRPNLQFNLAAQTKSVRLLYPDGLRTVLDANLALTGTTTAASVNGRVVIDSLSFTPDFDVASFSDQFSAGQTVSQPGFADKVRLAIAVQSHENLSATSSQISVEGQAALQVGGTAANPVITGRTTLNSGELFYRNVRYQLQTGVITFDNPNQTHPVLNLSVTTTIEQYNLTLTLRGPLDKLTTSYTSDPPLATADIINLVARGKTTQESAASSQSTDSMIASQAASELSSSVQRLVGISSLQIDPTLGGNNQNPSARIAIQQRVTKNFLFSFSTDVSQPGSEIIQGEYQINKRWSVSMARDESGGVSVDGRYHTRF